MYRVGYWEGNRFQTLAKFDDVQQAARLARRWHRALDRQSRWANPFVSLIRCQGGSVFEITRWYRSASVETRRVYLKPLDH